MSEQESLSQKRCKPCEGGVAPLDEERVAVLLGQLDGWQTGADGASILRRFEFKDFYRTMAFVNALAWVANQEDHHPDFKAGYNYCEVRFTTHAIGGLSENDFICAAKTQELLEG